jgi:hypothetical protein
LLDNLLGTGPKGKFNNLLLPDHQTLILRH